MDEAWKIEEFGGIRYKIFLDPTTESGVSKIHIERVVGSDVFEKMTSEEVRDYVGAMFREKLSGHIVGGYYTPEPPRYDEIYVAGMEWLESR